MSEIVPHKSNCKYWAVRPALKRAIIGRFDSLSCNGVRETTLYISYIIIYIALTGNILISPEWGGDLSLIREYDSVRRSGREQAL
jgi:hypothetical protein